MSLLTNIFTSQRDEPLAGIDISSSSIKLVELSRAKRGGYILECCGIEPLEKGWVTDGNIDNFDAVVNALKRLIRTTGTKAKTAALAMPTSAVITKKVLLPSDLSESEMEVYVEAEASQYIPFPLEEVRLDFYVIGPSAESDGEVEVLLAASRKERVDDRQALAEEAGLKVEVVDVDVFASRLAALQVMRELKLGAKNVVALFDIGGGGTTVQVLNKGQAVYEREMSFGGKLLTEAMMRHYGFTFEEAEAKKRLGDVPADFESALLPDYIENISEEVARTLQLFLSSTVYGRVDQILLGGGAANVKGLEARVTMQSGCPSRLLNPFERMEYSSRVRQPALAKEAPSYITACGLAMRRFVA